MTLTDVVSSLGLTFFPIVGMVIFLAVFVVVIMRISRRGIGGAMREFAMLPLDDGPRRSGAPASNPKEARP